jgi:ubiquitin C-terminal hydrolase
LLVCCLLLSQQAALLHAISHLEFPHHARNTRSEIVAIALDQVASSGFCLECEAFAQVATVASDTPIVVSVVSAPAVAIVAQAQHSQDPAVLPPFLARAPPIAL